MILAVLFANSEGNILVERFNGVPAEERLHWRSFLVKLGADNLKGVKNEELLVACHKGFQWNCELKQQMPYILRQNVEWSFQCMGVWGLFLNYNNKYRM
ncbi:uncharacterized protein LOC133802291 isoform X1 [Humulus lupulus]|uniref:uncharacterized protein LOC133802291 isoform X1 n=1 Tax=Humulus lupulus TaxID=3486 RepID=UPI002B409858|nr:uncharacterized protein LOC133802291 isoform X1 [Humulus lupulus]